MRDHKYYRAKKFKEQRAKQWHEIAELTEDNRENPLSRHFGIRRTPVTRFGFSKKRLFGCSCRQCRNYREKYKRCREKGVDEYND